MDVDGEETKDGRKKGGEEPFLYNPIKNRRKKGDRQKMCKTIEIKYSCDRCGKTETKGPKKVRIPIQWTGLWPQGYKRLHGRHVCTSCHNEFYTNTLKTYFNGGKKVATQ